MWLYKLLNKVNGKGYIGTSVNPISHRVSRHLYAAKCGRKDMAIACAIRKHGIENFEVRELGMFEDYAQLLQAEAKAIVSQRTRVPDGYNVSAGGMGARRACSQETRDRISSKTKGRIPWNFGKRNSLTVKRYANRGNIGHPPIGSKPWNMGKKAGPMPEEMKAKIAEGVRRVRATKFWSSRKATNLRSKGV